MSSSVSAQEKEIRELRQRAREIRYKAKSNPRPGYKRDIEWADKLDREANQLEMELRGIA